MRDSLTGLELVGTPAALADVGAGAGLPGTGAGRGAAGDPRRPDRVGGAARPSSSSARSRAARLANARAVRARSEAWAAEPEPDGGREAYDVVTARAVGRLATLAELASPLLREGGALVAWKGRRDPDEEAELERAAARLAMEPAEVPPRPGRGGVRAPAPAPRPQGRPDAPGAPAAPGDGEEAAARSGAERRRASRHRWV